ncbi:MAG: hypothetical protein ACTHOE_07635 [Conexibacter sp.]
MKRLALLMAVVAVALALAAPAYAQNAVSDAYAGKGGGIVGTVEGGNGPTASTPQQVKAVNSSNSGSLPFTGLDIGLLAVGGIALVGVGVGLRRFARPLS